mmetsp:Transcript_107694/g.313446  ORF Transcript_107694/g.313446 Transcript_107694/m.313446 type:complete len:211 (-) Transcript_107694:1184-1816(-)
MGRGRGSTQRCHRLKTPTRRTSIVSVCSVTRTRTERTRTKGPAVTTSRRRTRRTRRTTTRRRPSTRSTWRTLRVTLRPPRRLAGARASRHSTSEGHQETQSSGADRSGFVCPERRTSVRWGVSHWNMKTSYLAPSRHSRVTTCTTIRKTQTRSGSPAPTVLTIGPISGSIRAIRAAGRDPRTCGLVTVARHCVVFRTVAFFAPFARRTRS